jgi:signal transduction histidine kinase
VHLGHGHLRPKLRGIRPTDLAIAVAVAAVQVGGTALAAGHQHGQRHCFLASDCAAAKSLDALAYVLLALGPVALLARRRHPRAVFATVFCATLLHALIGYAAGPIYLSLIIAFGNVVVAGHRIVGWVTVVVGWALFLWLPAAFGREGTPTPLEALALAAWLLVLLAAAEGVRIRRERVAESRRAHEQEAQRRADEERLRIARELHDVLAHNISLINVQSGVALHLLEQQPEQARTALSAINDASSEALCEMRAILGVMRQVDEPLPRTPAAGLVRLDYRDRDLTLEIDDDGRGGTPSTVSNGGNGIAGMRERAAALGGDLEAGPRPGGGFRVRARLPVSESR